MKEKAIEEPKKGSNGFWKGLTLGVFVSLFLSTTALYYYLGMVGFQINLDQSIPAILIRDQIKQEASLELSVLLEKLRIELPAAIRQNFQRLDRLMIRFEDGEVSLPREVGELVKKELQSIAEKSVFDSLTEIDLTPYIEELGQAALAQTRSTLDTEVAGKTYNFKANPWLTIPITIQAK
ncbi:MAG TPA: hypothetical protein DDW93_07600 [Firmicutes bacterium]|nr:hypothetical protein [Bacillota bacterium]HBT17810.1 hypothetical protein [Bacillota bacterium]